MPEPTEQNFARVFVAFPVPSILTEELKSIREQNNSLKGIRWTPLPNLHVTLFFLGEVSEKNLTPINLALSKVIECTPCFKIEFEKITLAGKKKQGGMIWARFYKNDFYATLSTNLHHAVHSFLIVQPVLKDPVPHITLARFRRETEIDQINLFFENNFSLPEINCCELWKSVQTKKGVVYKSLRRFELCNL